MAIDTKASGISSAEVSGMKLSRFIRSAVTMAPSTWPALSVTGVTTTRNIPFGSSPPGGIAPFEASGPFGSATALPSPSVRSISPEIISVETVDLPLFIAFSTRPLMEKRSPESGVLCAAIVKASGPTMVQISTCGRYSFQAFNCLLSVALSLRLIALLICGSVEAWSMPYFI